MSPSHYRLQELAIDNPDRFYEAWPDVSTTEDRWKPLLEPLYLAIVQHPCFYSHTLCAWTALNHSVLQQVDVAVSEEVMRAVVKVYTLTQQNLVQLPKHILLTLRHFGLLDNVEVINVARVSQLTASCLLHLTQKEKLDLLSYFSLYDSAHDVLLNQQLLPLADGAFGTFKDERDAPVFWCHNDLAQLFPDIESRFCNSQIPADVNEYLHHLAESGTKP